MFLVGSVGGGASALTTLLGALTVLLACAGCALAWWCWATRSRRPKHGYRSIPTCELMDDEADSAGEEQEQERHLHVDPGCVGPPERLPLVSLQVPRSLTPPRLLQPMSPGLCTHSFRPPPAAPLVRTVMVPQWRYRWRHVTRPPDEQARAAVSAPFRSAAIPVPVVTVPPTPERAPLLPPAGFHATGVVPRPLHDVVAAAAAALRAAADDSPHLPPAASPPQSAAADSDGGSGTDAAAADEAAQHRHAPPEARARVAHIVPPLELPMLSSLSMGRLGKG